MPPQQKTYKSRLLIKDYQNRLPDLSMIILMNQDM